MILSSRVLVVRLNGPEHLGPLLEAAHGDRWDGESLGVRVPVQEDMVSYDLPPERVASLLKADLEACRDCHVDITLKDVQTVQGDGDRVRRWVAITRRVIDDVFA